MSTIDLNLIKKLLLTVEKPSRYTGGEFNTPDVKKPHRASFCFCFPDIYEIGMSNLGLQILYDVINNDPDFVAERCYAPWTDFGEKLKENDIPLFSLETKTPLKDFDVVGFSVQFELLYTNVLYMLELAKIPFRASERNDSYPLLIAGGPCAVNPEPFKDFFDLIVIGEGEEVDLEVLRQTALAKEQGISKKELLERLAKIEGVYVPSVHKKGEKVTKAVVKDFENAPVPTRPLVPNLNIIHDRVVMELYRGCASGCRFCQAGFYYRPIREKSADRVAYLAKSAIDATGYEELSLCSLSTGDYSYLKELIFDLKQITDERKVNLSLPSLRLNSFEGEIAQNSRRSSLTFAPEAGTQRLRNVINKNISDDDINNIGKAFAVGYQSVKLYFMMGLPTETNEDLDGIAEICQRLRALYYSEKRQRPLSISVSCSVFIPKPCTPFQWSRQIGINEMLEKQEYLRGKLREIKGVKFSWHGAESSKLEAALARGGEELSDVIEEAYKSGSKFDSWSEYFDWENWLSAFEKCGIDINDYSREYSLDEDLPWDFIDTGVPKSYFKKEYEKALKGETTRNCRNGCNGCGASKLGRCTII
ncbi:MAG: TIGR03960 family B12-binding radical SAM protein [Acidaminococcus sp.]|nr:TIGR03960 family B12-binding radical SAM protein [Acidaminococcus sp.]